MVPLLWLSYLAIFSPLYFLGFSIKKQFPFGVGGGDDGLGIEFS